MLRIIRSNHVDALASALAGRIGAFPLPDPMAAEQIVVHHRGMARWLQHRLALSLGSPTSSAHAGICALVEFPFPQATLHQICAWMQNKEPVASTWSPQALTWTIAEALVQYQHQPEFRSMAHPHVDRDCPKPTRRYHGIARRSFSDDSCARADDYPDPTRTILRFHSTTDDKSPTSRSLARAISSTNRFA